MSPAPTLTTRRATVADAPAIAEFNQAMALETEAKTLESAVILAGVERMVRDTSLGFYLVTEHSELPGAIVGCLGITFEWSDWRNGLFWWIQSVYVLPAYRGQGVFRSLYDTVSNLARSQTDVCGIRLYVEHDNVNAQKTYTALGMSRTDYHLFEVEF